MVHARFVLSFGNFTRKGARMEKLCPAREYGA